MFQETTTTVGKYLYKNCWLGPTFFNKNNLWCFTVEKLQPLLIDVYKFNKFNGVGWCKMLTWVYISAGFYFQSNVFLQLDEEELLKKGNS